MATILLVCITQPYTKDSCTLLQGHFNASFRDPKLGVSSIASTSQYCASAKLLLLLLRN
jgi:hypothetical protein